MDKKSKILVLIFLCLIVASIYMLYKRSFIDANFEITDSSQESDSSTSTE